MRIPPHRRIDEIKMASPSMVQRSGDTLIVRSVVSGDRLFMDVSPSLLSSPTSGLQVGLQSLPPLPSPPRTPHKLSSSGTITPEEIDLGDNGDLPECRIKRNYNCVHDNCEYFTQNPRHYLTHVRDVHDEKIKIYDCPNCLYASRHFQKLLRHMKMVHGSSKNVDVQSVINNKQSDAPENDGVEEMDVDQVISEKKDYTIHIPETKPKVIHSCSLCPFTTIHPGQLTRHERKDHIKTKFFPCSKCNYVTHIKARFTKHVKYHSMPMIKCEVCDFRTPYKWNLDRHMKNHGGAGAFCCSVCNFTADIKQSLTVHEMNHHVPPAGQGGSTGGGGAGAARRRNKVGGSDALAAALAERSNPPCSPSQAKFTDNENSTEDSMQSDFNDGTIMNGDDKTSSNQSMEIDDNMQNNNFDQDSIDIRDEPILQNIDTSSEKSLKEDETANTQSKKMPRPIPNLIPLHLQTNQPQKSTPLTNGPLNLSMIQNKSNICDKQTPDVKLSSKKDTSTPLNIFETMYNDDSNCDNISIKGSDESSQQSSQVSTKIFKKKNASFFDKLKEKLLTTSVESGNLACKDCGHLSKCLSEHSVHEKICSNSGKTTPNNFHTAGLGSTRCQYCRHRCKSSLDLVIHMQSCVLAGKDRESPIDHSKADKIEVPINPESEEEASVDDPQVPHPMENVVFVWNSMLQNSNSSTFDNSPNDPQLSNAMSEENAFNKNVITSTPNNRDVAHSTPSGKKVFKCPHCLFWASTASRFHVHIVGHLNKKPFECSLCSYRSNWRWDITKHIRLKSVRDPEHSQAKVLMTDETGRRNYSKYNKYLTIMQISGSGDTSTSKKNRENTGLAKGPLDLSETAVNLEKPGNTAFSEINLLDRPVLDFQSTLQKDPINEEIKLSFSDDNAESKKVKRSMWKCKKCTYRNTSKEALLVHVRKHSRSNNLLQPEPKKDESNTSDNVPEVIGNQSYRCGHCYQVSNWKHVIQRHCRLKHNGDVRVIVGESCSSPAKVSTPKMPSLITEDGRCVKCPFTSDDRNVLEVHVKKHSISSDSIYKCFICSYYVNTEYELIQHLPLHGVSDPEQYMANIINTKITNTDNNTSLKRYQCIDCPYESNSKSQFMYHEQFHKCQDAPFKCEICNYQVSKRHLLHQHMKVHGIQPQKDTADPLSLDYDINSTLDLPFMWVSYEGEFQKMYKCRYCPYVKQKQCNILDHEKMHMMKGIVDDNNLNECANCSFACDNIDFFVSHCQVHKPDYARVLCQVNPAKSDEEQISYLKEIMKTDNTPQNHPDNYINDENSFMEIDNTFDKLLYFCNHCPARFMVLKELQIHIKFHSNRLPYQCQVCSYTARQQAHLMSHSTVHSEEYQEKTKVLQDAYSTHPDYKQPNVVVVVSGMNVPEPVWIVVADGKKNESPVVYEEPDITSMEDFSNKQTGKHFLCNQCPAKFFKNAALHYHLSLHGGNGQFKCKQCNYAVKTIGNLVKHEAVHGNHEKNLNVNDYESGDDNIGYKNIPLSGTDLFHHKTEVEKRAMTEKLITRPNDHFPPVLQADPQFGLLMHGNPDFIYPTYLKNGRQKEKRYKCHKCPSAFEKREQYKVHLSLHGSKQRYRCELCDYSVKYYANYVQHMRKHQMNADAHAARQNNSGTPLDSQDDSMNLVTKSLTLAIKSLPRNIQKDTTKLSISDQQTLKLLNRRRSSAASSKDVNEEKKNFRCSYCPYTNQRRDALDNHIRRHICVSGIGGNFECSHCDYAAPQSHILRDHLKVHFNTQKHLTPEYFTNFEGLEVFVTQVDTTEELSRIKKCIFKNNKSEEDMLHLNSVKDKIFVVPSTGEKIHQMNTH